MPHEPTDPPHRVPRAEVIGDRPRATRREPSALAGPGPVRRPILISTPPPVGGVRRVRRRARPETRPRSAITHWFCTTLLREA